MGGMQKLDINNPSERVNTRLDPELSRAVTALAIKERRTYSAMARLLIEEALDSRSLTDTTR